MKNENNKFAIGYVKSLGFGVKSHKSYFDLDLKKDDFYYDTKKEHLYELLASEGNAYIGFLFGIDENGTIFEKDSEGNFSQEIMKKGGECATLNGEILEIFSFDDCKEIFAEETETEEE